jgi:RNA polymerase sigma factor (sigma-70 family)
VRRADLGVTTIAGLAGADRAASPSQAAGAAELDAQLERALLALGTPQRQIVYCRLVLEMGFAEIAADLGIASADSARALFHKAMAKLRERLDAGRGDAES